MDAGSRSGRAERLPSGDRDLRRGPRSWSPTVRAAVHLRAVLSGRVPSCGGRRGKRAGPRARPADRRGPRWNGDGRIERRRRRPVHHPDSHRARRRGGGAGLVKANGAPVERIARRILLVEDEPSLVTTLVDRLRSEGYEVESVGDGDHAVVHPAIGFVDLVILDVMLPGKSGFDVCRDLRQRGIQTPILMLTARSQVVDRVVGLKLGADDYLTKPFEMIELVARVEALLRRGRAPVASGEGRYAFGDVQIDFRRAEVLREDRPVSLSALEFKLLQYFIAHRGALLTRDELLDNVWGYDATPVTRTVDVHVSSLRQKLERNPGHPEFILTVHRLGYKFAG